MSLLIYMSYVNNDIYLNIYKGYPGLSDMDIHVIFLHISIFVFIYYYILYVSYKSLLYLKFT